MKTNARSESQTFKALEEAVSVEGSQIVEAQVGQKIILSEDAQMEIIFPFEKINESSKDTNAGSVVARLVYGENSFLLTGDLPGEQEKEILARGINITSDVLKVSHHGSKYSSSEDFLKEVGPRDAIVSVGKSNSYGHPNQEALQRIAKQGTKIFRTDELGDIVYECQEPNVECQKKY
ncbi:MAG: Metallo beta-lactamase family protein [uncultured bacterium]|nr:MAG: Metallo beta-lactamase family protein [uncultured bacterium]